jgi:uncharacterized membrane protein YeaQ/YmgE (transglycosylase-associated protein family)
MKLLYKPVSILVGVLCGMLAKAVFRRKPRRGRGADHG